VGATPALLSVVTGVVVVACITFFEVPIGSWDSGFIALGPNLVVLVIAEAIRRRLHRRAVGTGASAMSAVG
jgi:SSS family solute:Na+ symporter